MGIACTNPASHELDYARLESKLRLEGDVRQAQKDAFEKKQEKLLALAEAQLEGGGLLDEKIVSYLAAIPPDFLRGASDQLALTVFQARHLLRFDRTGQRPRDRVATFARHGLNPLLADHRLLLRSRLEENNPDISEDSSPVAWPDMEGDFPSLESLPAYKKLHHDGMRGVLRFFAMPLFAVADTFEIRRARKAPVPAFTVSAKIPPLRCAEDFSAALARYEKEVERLDLPAMRGWGGRGVAPALPASAVITPPRI
jgi:hypothetical protein